MIDFSKRIPPEGIPVNGYDGVPRMFSAVYSGIHPISYITSRADSGNLKAVDGFKIFVNPATQSIDSLTIKIPGNPEVSGRINYDIYSSTLIELNNAQGHNWKMLSYKDKQETVIDELFSGDPKQRKYIREIRVTGLSGARSFWRNPAPGNQFTINVYEDCEEFPNAVAYCMEREKELLGIAEQIAGIDLSGWLRKPVGTSWLSFVSDQSHKDQCQLL